MLDQLFTILLLLLIAYQILCETIGVYSWLPRVEFERFCLRA